MDAQALQEAFRLLRTRDRFASQVWTHLLAKGFEERVVEEVVSYLLERKLINETKTTQRLIENKSGKRSVGKEKLRAELEKLGAPGEIVEQELAVAAPEHARALEALHAKFREKPDRPKAGRFLYSRGFAEDAIETALDEFLGTDAFPE